MTDPTRDREASVMAIEIVRPTFENAPETRGPCVHCGLGMAEHQQAPDDPTAFACPRLPATGRNDL